jgi:hypothetical protein
LGIDEAVLGNKIERQAFQFYFSRTSFDQNQTFQVLKTWVEEEDLMRSDYAQKAILDNDPLSKSQRAFYVLWL